MSVEATKFEERLLPVLVEELTLRPHDQLPATRSSRAKRRGAVGGLVVLITSMAVVFAAVSGSSETEITVEYPSEAMQPTIRVGEIVTVNTSAYETSAPARGDVVAFRSDLAPDHVFISRVIGLPADVVTEDHGVVSVNGQVLDEPYAQLDDRSGQWTVEPGHVFVMGDNRPHAADSRLDGAGAIGQIPFEALVGQVLVGSSSAGDPDIPAGPAGISSVGPSAT